MKEAFKDAVKECGVFFEQMRKSGIDRMRVKVCILFQEHDKKCLNQIKRQKQKMLVVIL